ncbi:MAG: chemotaxis protein CheA [Isosphaeraceae bacterium]
MSGFDLNELLPYYLDETDEQIVGLNDALLKLESDPTDAPVLREAFRLIHSIKGASTVMGFDQVKHLTHHLETFFDRLRSGERTLDRSTLDLCFRCLDGLRDYHRELRSGGASSVDLSGLTQAVIASLAGTAPAADAAPEPEPEPAFEPEPEVVAEGPEEEPAAEPPPVAVAEAPEVEEEPVPAVWPGAADPGIAGACVLVTLGLAKDLPWPDMKAKLVLNRLGSKARVLASDPPAEQLETVDRLTKFRVWLETDAEPEELRGLADVEGVDTVRIETVDAPPSSSPVAEPAPPVVPVAAPAPAPVTTARPAPVSATPAPAPTPTPAPAPPPEPAPARSPAAPPAEAAPAAAAAPKKVAETLRVDVDRLDHLMNLAGELVINRARFYEIAQGLEELFRDSNARMLTADTQDRLDGLGHELENFVGSAGSRVEGAVERWAAQFRRLRDNFEEIRRELDLVRLGRERVNALSEAIHQLARVTDGLQKGVLETRMVPIGPLFERFHRVVRDLRHSSGKEVTLRIEGEKTELDKRMIDELGDPLVHMVRNSVDHGLESPDDRERAGKPRSGTVSLQASHRGNSVVITVGDDGRGIDVERIRRKIVEKGLVHPDEAARLNERQLVPFIWHPGLSTAERITDISGRGVGMDIVKARIESLNGTVDVRTEPGQGTTFVIRLPLTLAILPCLLFRIFEEVYAVPTDHVDEIVEVAESEIFRVRGRRMIEIRGRLVSLVALDDVLTWGVSRRRPAQLEGSASEPSASKLTVVVAQNGETTIGLLVDQLIGMQEVVLKSLEKNFRAVPSLSGASILGDGRVSLILDLDALIEMVARSAGP